MYKYLYVGSIKVPSYGLMILLGITICLCLAMVSIEKSNSDYLEFLILVGVAGSGALLGSKLFWMVNSCVENFPNVPLGEAWSHAGMSYYGGLAGFLLFARFYLSYRSGNRYNYCRLIWLLPLLHVFWKIGCYMGGCCIGIPYSGPVAVQYPDKADVSIEGVFLPIQLIEAGVALLISLHQLYLVRKESSLLGLFLMEYSGTRFFLEFLRYHESGLIISMGHIWSLIFFGIGLYFHWKQKGVLSERKRTKYI